MDGCLRVWKSAVGRGNQLRWWIELKLQSIKEECKRFPILLTCMFMATAPGWHAYKSEFRIHSKHMKIMWTFLPLGHVNYMPKLRPCGSRQKGVSFQTPLCRNKVVSIKQHHWHHRFWVHLFVQRKLVGFQLVNLTTLKSGRVFSILVLGGQHSLWLFWNSLKWVHDTWRILRSVNASRRRFQSTACSLWRSTQ